jgi:serine/threonine-protein kinase
MGGHGITAISSFTEGLPAPHDRAVESALAVAVGTRLGKYLVTEKLGEGGMGVVFGGVHEALGRKVAIKLLRAEFVKNESVVLRFQQEAEAVSRIGHANIVAVYDFGRADDGSVYYVMELIPGETLTKRMRRDPPVTPSEACAIFSQICRALTATHSRNIIHRDLKPDNVLLQTTDGGAHVKLVDFGVAKMREDGDVKSNLTKSGTLLGTPTYMAPEQITAAATVDGRADLYSLGAMVYELLTGQPPFGRGEVIQILTRHVREPPMPPSLKVPEKEIPPALDAFVLRALAKRPEERQANAAEFAAELEKAWGVTRASTQMMVPVGQAATTITAAPTPAPVAAARRWPIIAGVAVLVGGGAAVGLGVMRGKKVEPTAKPLVTAPVVDQSPLHLRAANVISAGLSGDGTQRRETVEVLGEVGDRQSVPDLVTALGDDNPEVRRAAAVAAVTVGRPEDAELRRALVDAAGRSGGAVAVELAASRVALGDLGATDDLQKALGLRDGAARLRAAVALADAGLLQAPALRAAVAAAPPTVRRTLRWAAYQRLYHLGDQNFVAELRAALAGTDAVARLDAAQALARQKDDAGLLALADIEKNAADPVDRVEAAAIRAELGDSEARTALLTALKDPAPAVRAKAAAALGRLLPSLPPGERNPVGPRLATLLDDPERAPKLAAAAALLALDAQRTPTL